jgi:predicted P-loop ATPase
MTNRSIPSITAKEEAVNGYIAAGFTLFPCGDGPELKDPKYGTMWTEAEYDPMLTAEDLPGTYGLKLPPDVLVIDWDPRNETPDNKDQLKRFWAQYGVATPLDTFTVATGGGGCHVHFKKPEEVYVRGKVPGFPAIDVKSAGGYVIAAGSKHFKGPDYEVIRGDYDKILPCPPKVLEAISYVAGLKNEDIEPDDSPGSIRQFTDYCKIAVKQRAKTGVPHRFVVACYGKVNCNLPREKTLEIMQEHFNPSDSGKQSLEKKVNNAYNYSQGGQGAASPEAVFTEISENTVLDPADAFNQNQQWTRIPRNGVVCLNHHALNNVVNHLELMPSKNTLAPLYKLFKYNEFKRQIEFANYAPWHDINKPVPHYGDADIAAIKLYLAKFKTNNPTVDFSMTVSDELIRQAVLLVAKTYSYHPVKDWLELLKWDGKPRLDRLLVDYAGAPDTPYVKEVAKNTLIGAVARIMEPGCKQDHMLILEGPQGIGKSTFVAILGGEHYADIPISPKEKDTVAGMQGAWILEASEMEMLKRADVAALKRFLTVTTDKVRLPYDHIPSILPRQSIFIGTVNPSPEGYFRDETGNRRFWPAACLKFDLQALKRDRDQLFAEAVARYQSGEAWHLDKPDVMAIAIAEQEKRMETDSWEETVKNWFASGNLPESLTTDNIGLYALNLTAAKMGQAEKRRLCTAIRASGFEHKSAWSKELKCHIKVWVKVESEDDL